MKTPRFDYQKKFEPIRNITLFFVVLLVANLFWKYNVLGDESTTAGSSVTFWGLNISAPFIWMSGHVAHVAAFVLQFFGSQVSLLPSNILQYSNGNSVQVIWSCTGIKQAYICFCILVFSWGPWKRKVWYIPACLLVVYLFNIVRISIIVGCIENHPHWFQLLHHYIFKYLFYGIIFLMWMFWEENIVNRPKKLIQTNVKP